MLSLRSCPGSINVHIIVSSVQSSGVQVPIMFGRFLRITNSVSKTTWCKLQASRSLSSEVVTKNADPSEDISAADLDPNIQQLLEIDQDSLRVSYSTALDRNLDPFSSECDQEFIDELGPPPEATFSLAKYVNQMPTLQRLVDLGVKLYKLEKSRPTAEYLTRLDFDRDIKEHLLFLHQFGVPDKQLGPLLTQNIYILKENIENLKTRLKFLKDYGFSHKQVLLILERYPTFINYGVDSMINLFDFLIPEFYLKKSDIPTVITNRPQIIQLNNMRFREISFCLKEEAELHLDQIRKIVIGCGNIFAISRRQFISKYDLLSAEAGYHNKVLANHPQVFSETYSSLYRKVLYLKTLKLLEPDPRKPGFIPLSVLCEYDEIFVARVRTSLPDYYNFLKSI